MNIFPVLACLLAPVVVLCAIALFTLGSDLARPLRYLSAPLAILLALVAVFVFLLPEAHASLSVGLITLIVLASCFCFFLFGHEVSVCRRSVCEFTKVSKNAPKTTRHRFSRPALYLTIAVLDLFGVLLAGLTAGFSFLGEAGAGYIVICALVLFTIPQSLSRLTSYQELIFPKRITILIAFAAALIFVLSSVLSYLLADGRLLSKAVLLTLAAAYLLYLASWHLFFIVRARLKR